MFCLAHRAKNSKKKGGGAGGLGESQAGAQPALNAMFFFFFAGNKDVGRRRRDG